MMMMMMMMMTMMMMMMMTMTMMMMMMMMLLLLVVVVLSQGYAAFAKACSKVFKSCIVFLGFCHPASAKRNISRPPTIPALRKRDWSACMLYLDPRARRAP